MIPDLTVAQNIFLGREPKRKWGFLDYRKMYEGAWQALQRLNVADIEPQDFVRDLSVNQLQDVTDEVRHRETSDVYAAELRHRIGNILTLVKILAASDGDLA